MSKSEVICDLANKELLEVPKDVLNLSNLKMLYLENNSIVKLPDTFFVKLPELTWLDLRNNQLQCLPKNIGEHKCLQNLLLQNNLLTQLPEELGLLSTLRVLQISGNHIIYPPDNVQLTGIGGIIKFLKNQYYFKLNEQFNETPLSYFNGKGSSKLPSSSIKSGKSKEDVNVREVLRKLSNSRMIKSQLPVVDVKSLTKQNTGGTTTTTEYDDDNIGDDNRNKKLHKVTKTCSKLSVQSNISNKYLEKKIRNKEMKVNVNQLRDVWLNKLRDLITDQQKIIQQEKNLTALSEWRLDKKLKSSVKPTVYVKPEPPYDINEEFDKILSRKDLSEPIQKLIKNRTPAGHKKVDIERFVSEVIAQLKKIENEQNPKCSEDDIKTILNLQKKISTLKSLNDRY